MSIPMACVMSLLMAPSLVALVDRSSQLGQLEARSVWHNTHIPIN